QAGGLRRAGKRRLAPRLASGDVWHLRRPRRARRGFVARMEALPGAGCPDAHRRLEGEAPGSVTRREACLHRFPVLEAGPVASNGESGIIRGKAFGGNNAVTVNPIGLLVG